MAAKYGAASLERLYKTGAGKNGGEEIVLSIVYYPDVNEYRERSLYRWS